MNRFVDVKVVGLPLVDVRTYVRFKSFLNEDDLSKHQEVSIIAITLLIPSIRVSETIYVPSA